MSDIQSLFEQVDSLTPEEGLQLFDHVIERLHSFGMIVTKPRILGLHVHLGAAWISDDFDDELPDSFWLGEE